MRHASQTGAHEWRAYVIPKPPVDENDEVLNRSNARRSERLGEKIHGKSEQDKVLNEQPYSSLNAELYCPTKIRAT